MKRRTRDQAVGALAAMAGGALASYLLLRARRAGVRAEKAEALVGLAGAAGAVLGRGVVRSLACGAVAATAGSVALRWMAGWIQQRQAASTAAAEEPRNAADAEPPLSVDEAFEEAAACVHDDMDDEPAVSEIVAVEEPAAVGAAL